MKKNIKYIICFLIGVIVILFTGCKDKTEVVSSKKKDIKYAINNDYNEPLKTSDNTKEISDIYKYFNNEEKSGNISFLNSDKYKVMKDGKFLELPNKAVGILSAYVCDVDKDKNNEAISVVINKKLKDKINIGEIEINLINDIKSTNKISYKLSNQVINSNTNQSYLIYYYNGYIGIYFSYSSNFGMGSIYGFNFEILKISDSSIEVENDIVYSYTPGYCSLTDQANNKTYYSSKEDTTEIKDVIKSVNKDLPDCFSKLISFNESDFMINNVENLIALSEIKMGKTDYSTYYYQEFIDKTNFIQKLDNN